MPLHATKKPVPSNRKLMDAYDRYLIDLVQNELVQDMEKLQTMVRSMSASFFQISRFVSNEMFKMFRNMWKILLDQYYLPSPIKTCQ